MRLYHLFLYPDRVVGPYNLHCLREWLAMGIISAEYQVCLAGTEAWTPLHDVAEHDVVPPRLQKRIAARRANFHSSWWEQPASDRQRAKLDYFAIPYCTDDLTKARAAELIGYFVEIDPAREATYHSRPADADQVATLLRFGLEPVGLRHDEAKMLIEQARFEAHLEDVDRRVKEERRLMTALGLKP